MQNEQQSIGSIDNGCRIKSTHDLAAIRGSDKTTLRTFSASYLNKREILELVLKDIL